jgi:hypothetical protein
VRGAVATAARLVIINARTCQIVVQASEEPLSLCLAQHGTRTQAQHELLSPFPVLHPPSLILRLITYYAFQMPHSYLHRGMHPSLPSSPSIPRMYLAPTARNPLRSILITLQIPDTIGKERSSMEGCDNETIRLVVSETAAIGTYVHWSKRKRRTKSKVWIVKAHALTGIARKGGGERAREREREK